MRAKRDVPELARTVGYQPLFQPHAAGFVQHAIPGRGIRGQTGELHPLGGWPTFDLRWHHLRCIMIMARRATRCSRRSSPEIRCGSMSPA